jgi:hypothetical protein
MTDEEKKEFIAHPDYPKNLKFAKEFSRNFMLEVDLDPKHHLHGMKIEVVNKLDGTESVLVFSFSSKDSPTYANTIAIDVFGHNAFIHEIKLIFREYRNHALKFNAPKNAANYKLEDLDYELERLNF